MGIASAKIFFVHTPPMNVVFFVVCTDHPLLYILPLPYQGRFCLGASA
jgi:hypothetical protein